MAAAVAGLAVAGLAVAGQTVTVQPAASGGTPVTVDIVGIMAAAGTTVQIQSTVTNMVDGSPRNLAGATGVFLVYDQPGSVNPPVVTGGVAGVTDPAGGVVTWTLPPAATQSMVGEFHVLWFECRLVEVDGTVSVCDSGRLTLN